MITAAFLAMIALTVLAGARLGMWLYNDERPPMTALYCALQVWLLAPAMWLTQAHNRELGRRR